MSIINDLGWQISAGTQQRMTASTTDTSAAYAPVPIETAKTQSQRGGDTSRQSFQNQQNEAFAKLMLSLQNPERYSSDAQIETQSNARQEFLDYMALSPEDKIREKMLRELGLSLEDYEALPPEKKELIDRQIARRIEEEMEIKTIAKLQPMLQATMTAQALTDSQSSLAEGENGEDRKNLLD
ncbi:hypothetical protein [Pseudomonas aegrilactucae]|uniref:Uncharacterized protein n=1 Tax=Pseudomonas aegrilactucae TaxID=2854028 RepID=A0A9Q2XJ59_9PSED|nr:hypothetical protein [Pseudomonas aegrilactucae]MBV6287986.1 hypothetical protein [Pseudomonas aegrilactucae]